MSESKQRLTGKVQTVRGIINPESLGATSMHEHVLCDIRPPDWREKDDDGIELSLANHWPINYGEVDVPSNLVLNSINVATSELKKMRREGGRTLVEVSCGGLAPDPKGLKEVSETSDVHIVMGCGHYVHDYHDSDIPSQTEEEITQQIIDQIQVGAWDTNIRAGIIGEIGCQSPWTDQEKKVMSAAVKAMNHTGAALCIHPGRHADQPQEVAEFVRRQGGVMDRLIISHIDRTIFDEERMFKLANTGCVLEFDLFGMETSYYKWADIDMPNDAERLRWLKKLIERGHKEQIVIAQDICYRTRLSMFGGHGYGHIFRNVVPMMQRRGFSDEDIDQIIIHNPRRLLTFI